MIAPHLFTPYNALATSGQQLRDCVSVATGQYWHEVLIHALADAFGAGADTIRIEHRLDAIQLWLTVALLQDPKVPSKLVEEVRLELQSSIDFQQHNYDHPKSLPTLETSSIGWEQCNFEGHPTHPVRIRKSSSLLIRIIF